nr:PREDICTED: carbonic anhydrase 7 [Paralichthys olivaceus]
MTGNHWGYGKEDGPSVWHKNFPVAEGTRQSPIDIIPQGASHDPSLGPIVLNYDQCTSTNISNNGHSVVVEFEDSDDRSEEEDGLHLVHWNAIKYKTFGEAAAAPDGLAVLGIFLDTGDDHRWLHTITDALYMVKFKGSVTDFKGFNPKCLLPSSLHYWTYLGSLTTPPLHESVTWIVLKEPIIVSDKQMGKFRLLLFSGEEEDQRKRMENNFRPPQPLKGRKVRSSN